MKYIQSFYRYVVTFSSIGKSFPCKDAEGPMRNVLEITDEEYNTLMAKEPMFKSLVDRRKYRVLDKLPSSAKPAAVQINEAKAEAQKVKHINASLADENAALKARIAELEAQAAKKDEVQVTMSEEANSVPPAVKKTPEKKK